MPQRPLGEQEAGGELLEFNGCADDRRERRMADFDGHVFDFPAAAF